MRAATIAASKCKSRCKVNCFAIIDLEAQSLPVG